MKLAMRAYGAKFDLHCQRCGNTEWSEETFNSGANIYRKCLHCGADVYSDSMTRIVIVIEELFREFTPQTYDDIKGIEGLQSMGWRSPIIDADQDQRDRLNARLREG